MKPLRKLGSAWAVPCQEIENLTGWLTTVVGRVCLDMLRWRKSRCEDSFDVHLPDPVLSRDDPTDPEREALLADSIGLALLAAARGGDLDALLAVLDPDIPLRTDRGPQASREIRGARAVAQKAQNFSRLAETVQPVLVNGTAGIVSWLRDGRPLSVIGFTIRDRKIVEIDVLGDPARSHRLNFAVLNR